MAPKNKVEHKAKCGNSCCSNEQTSSVFIINNDVGTQELEMVKLQHPGTGKPAFFIFSQENKNIYELFTFSDHYRSYFIDNTVKSDGNFYITTPVDPLFLCLPYLSSSTHCSPLDQILRDDEYPDLERLVDCPALQNNITKIADKKGVTVFGYKYNEEKTLKWLEGKVNRTCAALIQQSVRVSSDSAVVSNNFVKNSSESTEHKDYYLKCAFGIICEYLNPNLKQKLQDYLNISIENEVVAGKRDRSTSQDSFQELKKSKMITDDDLKDYSPPKTNKGVKVKTPTVSAKEKARAKAALGSKSISSFFKKPT